MENTKPSYIEPGLLSLFRIFMTIQWLLLIVGLLSLEDSTDAGAPVLVVLMLLHTSILLLYLRIKRLQRWFKRVYLPLALIATTIMPIVAMAFAVAARLETGLRGEAAAGDGDILILWLFAPLMVVAAQYGFIVVIIFSAISTGLELFFGVALANEGSVAVNIVFEQAVIRNIIFLAIGYVISRLISAQRRQRESLREANKQLAQFAVTLEQLAISRERNRMARDLHDTLAHTLSAVAIQLEAVTAIWESSPDLARQRIDTIRQVTRDGLQETRKALTALRSSPLDDLGLTMALEAVAEKAAERAGFRLHVNMPDAMAEIPAETEINLYRVAEEALNNAVQHAEASDLWLTLSSKKRQIELRIRDNGVGFDTEEAPPNGHYGLVGMKERAALCDAVLSIESEPQVGTRISLQLKV
ncbi:MAG: sensor histidine kinase [Anaerolineae bacterium]|nr:sensor histidine kinase [Anaerolineae bacterium]MDQ7036138.1 sensor histidine kinase [Anaerolineae bacterium]